MTSLIGTPKPTATQASVERRPGWPSRLAALTPLWVQILVPFFAPTFFDPMGDHYANVLGVGLDVVVTGLTMSWMLIGLYAVWNARSWQVVALAYLFFTIPATFAVELAPALVLTIQNLG